MLPARASTRYVTWMSSEETLITCIYCTKTLPPSREHVLARSLGGDATRPITCSPCNTTVLSALDQALARRSLVAMARAAYTPSSAFEVELEGNHFHYDQSKDLHTDVTLTNRLKPRVFPQLHFRYGVDEVAVTGEAREDIDQLVAFVDRLIASTTLRKLHVKVGPADRVTTARLVVHRPKDGYLRVRTLSDEQKIFEALESKWAMLRERIFTESAVAVQNTIDAPTIGVGLSITLDDTFRAVTKTAFNVLATDVGVEFALRPEFNPVREYVLGIDIRHPENRAVDQVAVDERFVAQVGPQESPALPTATDEHLVTLFYHSGHVRACVTLYGDHSFFVDLGAIDLTSFTTVAHLFSSTRTGNHVLSLDEMYERIMRRAD